MCQGRTVGVCDHCDIPKASGELLVVHLWLVLSDSPSSGNLVWITHLELPAVTGPVYKVLATFVREELQKELKEKILVSYIWLVNILLSMAEGLCNFKLCQGKQSLEATQKKRSLSPNLQAHFKTLILSSNLSPTCHSWMGPEPVKQGPGLAALGLLP